MYYYVVPIQYLCTVCAKFYIDETVINYYKSPIIIEADFYSANLVRDSVDVMYMPITQIKYDITSKRALKPDTFKEYLTCKFVLNE